MFEFVSRYFGRNNDQSTWKTWQDLQDPQHFDKSSVFRYFVTQRPDALTFLKHSTEYSQMSSFSLDLHRPYIEYCFGEFEIFVINPCQEDLHKYVLLMIDLYDTCKGYSRHILGDASFITVLREYANSSDINILLNYSWMNSIYDYNDLHAHTVAYYSLSSLIALLMRNYVGRLYPRKNIPYITVERCKRAYTESVFGIKKITKPPQTPAVDIPTNSPLLSPPLNLQQGKTWPRMNNARCPECLRLTEGSWGKFNLCIDCYVNKKCVHCNADSDGLRNVQGMSVCKFHKSIEQKFGERE